LPYSSCWLQAYPAIPNVGAAAVAVVAAHEVAEEFREVAQDFHEAHPGSHVEPQDSPVVQDLVVRAAVQRTDLAPAVAPVSVPARAMDMAHAVTAVFVAMLAAAATAATMGTAAIMAVVVTTVAVAGADGVTVLASASALAGAGLITVTAVIPTGMVTVILATAMAIPPRITIRAMTNLPILMEMVPETLIFNNNSRSSNSNNRSSINNNSRNNTSSSHGIIRTRTRCRTDPAPMAIRPLVTREIPPITLMTTAAMTKNG
jgi:hypothetical protein